MPFLSGNPQFKEILVAKSLDNLDMLLNRLARETKAENRVVLVALVGDIHLKRAVPRLMGILNGDAGEAIINAVIVALRRIGDSAATTAIYEALGLLSVVKGAIALAQWLCDPVENVPAAAAGAINRNYNAVLAAGLKNMIRSGRTEARQVPQAVLNAGCDTIFVDLLEDDAFQACMVDFLSREAHPDVRTRYTVLMGKNGYTGLAAKIESRACEGNTPALKGFAVDDSTMILIGGSWEIAASIDGTRFTRSIHRSSHGISPGHRLVGGSGDCSLPNADYPA